MGVCGFQEYDVILVLGGVPVFNKREIEHYAHMFASNSSSNMEASSNEVSSAATDATGLVTGPANRTLSSFRCRFTCSLPSSHRMLLSQQSSMSDEIDIIVLRRKVAAEPILQAPDEVPTAAPSNLECVTSHAAMQHRNGPLPTAVSSDLAEAVARLGIALTEPVSTSASREAAMQHHDSHLPVAVSPDLLEDRTPPRLAAERWLEGEMSTSKDDDESVVSDQCKPSAAQQSGVLASNHSGDTSGNLRRVPSNTPWGLKRFRLLKAKNALKAKRRACEDDAFGADEIASSSASHPPASESDFDPLYAENIPTDLHRSVSGSIISTRVSRAPARI
jgi:hypothetical protein